MARYDPGPADGCTRWLWQSLQRQSAPPDPAARPASDRPLPPVMEKLCAALAATHPARAERLRLARAAVHRQPRLRIWAERLGAQPEALAREARLAALAASPEGRRVRAVEEAAAAALPDVAAEEVRAQFLRELVKNCADPRGFPYERLDLPEFGRNDFFRRRRVFLRRIAEALELVVPADGEVLRQVFSVPPQFPAGYTGLAGRETGVGTPLFPNL